MLNKDKFTLTITQWYPAGTLWLTITSEARMRVVESRIWCKNSTCGTFCIYYFRCLSISILTIISDK